MFTGLVQAVGTIAERGPAGPAERFVIDAGAWGYRPAPGESISVSGCCLTVAAAAGARWAFDAVPETLRVTALGGLRPGARVNLEHAARADTLLGGHVVQGHVDGVGTIERVETAPEWRLRVRPPAALMEFMVPKGSVCIEGVSLTLAKVDPSAGWFEVALIPTTLEKTTLADLTPGSRVNVETDIFARTVVHWLKNYRTPGT